MIPQLRAFLMLEIRLQWDIRASQYVFLFAGDTAVPANGWSGCVSVLPVHAGVWG